jgi:16S rRNA (cytosine1407-C5)-methyltransferase
LDRQEVEILAKRYGWTLEQVPFCPDGFRVRNIPNISQSDAEHQIGQYYIQDTASMLPVSLFDTRLMESRR